MGAKRLTRVDWLFGVLCAAAVLLSTCVQAQAKTGTRTEIVFWHFFGGGSENAAMEWLVNAFNKSQDQYEVKTVIKPWGNGLYEPLLVQVATGIPPDPVNRHMIH